MYSPQVRRLASELPNRGTLEEPTHRAAGENPVCGDRTSLELRVVQGRIDAVAFLCSGCAGAVAAAAGLTEMLASRSVFEALRIEERDLLDYLGGLPGHKRHGAMLALEVLHEALGEFNESETAVPGFSHR